MKRVKLTVAYDGTDYCGWQIQPNGITVEEVLNKALSELTGETIRVIGASRTDAGVHAKGNVAVFDTSARMPAERISLRIGLRTPPTGCSLRILLSCVRKKWKQTGILVIKHRLKHMNIRL